MSEHMRDRLHREMAGHQPPPAGDLVDRAMAEAVHTRKVRRTASGLGTVAVVGLTVLAVTVGSQLRAGSGTASSTIQAGSWAVAHVVIKVAPKGAAMPATALPATAVPAAAVPAAAVPVTVEPPPAATTGAAGAKVAEALAYHALQAAARTANPPQWTAASPGVPVTPEGELQLFTEAAAPYGNASHYAVSSDADKTHVKAYLTNAAGQTGMLQFSLYHATLGYAADCLPLDTPNRISCHHTTDGG